jgi:hypothetical protein
MPDVYEHFGPARQGNTKTVRGYEKAAQFWLASGENVDMILVMLLLTPLLAALPVAVR